MTGALCYPPRINLREVGPRDGLQNEQPVPLADKLAMLDALVRAGVRRIEATAFVSPRAVPALADAPEVAAALHRWPGVRWSALVASRTGAQRALTAGISELEYVLSAADGHSRANVRRDTATALGEVPAIVAATHAEGGWCEVIVATAWDCPFDGPTPADRVLRLVSEVVDMGADAVCLADTIGTATPLRVAQLLDKVRSRHPELPLGLHMHNTRGMAIAGVHTALQLGVVDIDSSIGGLGGCPFAPGASGNVATEEVAYLCRDMGIDTGTDLGRLIEAARLAEQMVGRPLDSGVSRAGDRRLEPATDQRGVEEASNS